MNEPTVEMLKRLLEAFSAHDFDAVMQFFVDDCVLEMPVGSTRGGGGSKVVTAYAKA